MWLDDVIWRMGSGLTLAQIVKNSVTSNKVTSHLFVTGVNYTCYSNRLENVCMKYISVRNILRLLLFISGMKYIKGRRKNGLIFSSERFKLHGRQKLQSFQFKLFHRVICMKMIYDMEIKASPQCSYCDEIDDISHFFFHSPNVRHMWYLFFQMWNGIEYHRVNF